MISLLFHELEAKPRTSTNNKLGYHMNAPAQDITCLFPKGLQQSILLLWNIQALASGCVHLSKPSLYNKQPASLLSLFLGPQCDSVVGILKIFKTRSLIMQAVRLVKLLTNSQIFFISMTTSPYKMLQRVLHILSGIQISS